MRRWACGADAGNESGGLLSERRGGAYDTRVTSTAFHRLRDVGIVALALVLASLGARPALAADSEKAPTERKDSASDSTGSSDSASDKSGAATVPQAQIDDEGPSARVAKKVHHGFKTAPVPSDVEEKPYWKSWVFWSVTGVLVAGTVGAFIYSLSGTRGSAGPCPADVSLSLGCFGAGRM